MTTSLQTAGHAALATLELHLCAPNDRNILPEREIIGILKDAAADEQASSGRKRALHKAVAEKTNHILVCSNSARRR